MFVSVVPLIALVLDMCCPYFDLSMGFGLVIYVSANVLFDLRNILAYHSVASALWLA